MHTAVASAGPCLEIGSYNFELAELPSPDSRIQAIKKDNPGGPWSWTTLAENDRNRR